MNKLSTSVVAGIGAAIAIGILTFSNQSYSDFILVMAPFGASTVIVFGLPNSPLAQPKNVIFGHLITAAVGLGFVHFIGVNPATLAIATGIGVSAMLLTDTTHPPAGANPLFIMMSSQLLGWSFLITPVLIGTITIVLVGKAMQSWQRKYA
ncbi:HPP family protein [Vibrio paucivorans]|uniref:HPP family protein n=1 Tax=Vibrio paucivorans TaxID=2829489 RepID=A0A9X3HT19_9VIBR|nr:HPP family protein [Vibrio paucivorans]MCW8335276.1 HPP family protein [Vibrio paucivorans]